MRTAFEILPLRPFEKDDIWPMLSGYETPEIYTVEKSESDELLRFEFRLAQLDTPYRTDYEDDFRPDELAWYQRLRENGYCFGAYRAEQLIGFAMGEAFPDEQYARIWEIHVLADQRRMGVGRALIERVVAQARHDGLRMILLETQNTNVKAIRFYRRMGFTLEAIDLSQYFALENEQAAQTAFFMKRWL